MQREFIEQITEFNKFVAKPASDFNKLTTNIIKRMTEQNLAIMDDFLTSSIKQLKDLGNAKKLEDVVAIQSSLVNESSSKMINCSQKMLNAAMENFSEFSKWLEDTTNYAVGAAQTATSVMGNKSGQERK